MNLVTGTGSGLGRYLQRELGALPLARGMPLPTEPLDTIVHCAFNKAGRIPLSAAYRYYQDNYSLTERLLRLPHQRFIYISSVEVYPHALRAQKGPQESADIDLAAAPSLYGQAKLFAEAMVRALGTRPLMLRCTSLLGADAKQNNLTRLLQDAAPELTLTADSQWNFVDYRHVLEVVRGAVREDWTGTLNLASAQNTSPGEIAHHLGKNPSYGTFRYDVGVIDNSTLASRLSSFRRSSLEILFDGLSSASS